MKRILFAVAAVVATGTLGCAGRAHLADSTGRSYQAAFAQQGAAPRGGITGPVTGLDSQEASIIARTYRGSLAPKVVRQAYGEQPILLLGPQAGESGTRMPPPSVPR